MMEQLFQSSISSGMDLDSSFQDRFYNQETLSKLPFDILAILKNALADSMTFLL